MNYSHLEQSLILIEYLEMKFGRSLTDEEKEFILSVLNLTYGDGYRKACEVTNGIKLL